MRKTILSLLACLLLAPLGAQTNFRAISFDEAMAAARKENKLVFIDFFTDWCGPCKKMASETFPQPQVGAFMNAQFVSIKLNAEKEGKELAARFQVRAYPTYIILNAEGKVQADLKGFMDGDAFISKVKAEMDPEMAPDRMKARYEGGERTPELVNAYALMHMEKGKEKEGFAIVDEYFHSLTDSQRLLPENVFLFTRYTIDLDNDRARFMVAHRDAFPPSVRDAVANRVERLYRSQLTSYFSGYQLRSGLYKEEEYQALKKAIKELKLEKNDNWAPVFYLIEQRLKLDDNAYLDLCAEKYADLEEVDRSLLLMNLTRLVPGKDPVLLKKMSTLIRSHLSEMSASTISVAARSLESIEAADRK